MVTVTVRLIRSFEYRSVKSLVIHQVDVSQTVDEFTQRLKHEIQTKPGLLLPFRSHSYDTLKLYCHAQGMKPNDLVINRDNDSDLILKSDNTLSAYSIANETELSYFNMHEYEAYKFGNETKW